VVDVIDKQLVVVVVIPVVPVVTTAIKVVMVAVDCGCLIVQPRGTYTHMFADL